ncbi:unnamed protein product, partial [Heligmosomoides polygyrus]|uniref:HTH_48 domain-containing protein n=1 Tax=Heligmosomoides polygyrus TaxID=6339 RepID=A0A183GT73_HELPZ
MDKRVIRGIYWYEFKLGTTAKEADEKINAAFGQGCSTKLGTTAKEADEKINAAFGQRCSTIRTAYRWYQGGTRRSTPHSVKDVPQFGRRIVGIRSCGMEMRSTPHSVKDVPQFGRRIVGIRSSGMDLVYS